MPPHEPDDELLTAKEVAVLLKCSVRTVRRLKDLPVVALGKRMLRYRRSEVLEWVRTHHLRLD